MRFIDHFLLEHRLELGLGKYGIGNRWETVLLTPRFVTSRHVVALVFPAGGDEPRLVVKVPRQPHDNDGVRHEAAVLKSLAAAGLGSPGGVPEVLAVKDVGAHTVLVETALTGSPLDPRLVAADLDGAVRAGARFVAALPSTRPAPANGGWYEHAIRKPLHALTCLVPEEPRLQALVQRTHEVLAPLASIPLPAVVEHGDLSHPNLFLKPDGMLQVVDWERSRTEGVPGHDLVFYLQYLSESNEQAFLRENQVTAFDKAFGAGGWALAPLARHLELRRVDTALLPLLVIAAWARSAATLSYRLAGQAAGAEGRKQILDAVTADRDFWLWRHVVTTWAA